MSLWDWLFRRRQREEELDEEVQAHLRMAARPFAPLRDGSLNRRSRAGRGKYPARISPRC
jgi:hypothetical protein